uniref:Uncharacterized protein n=1 Tax=Strombidinopsis acuminata TaxID=141414 RepID=A0A7S3S6Q7_9SPIT|mmetsp:Transcript_22465/g.30850  ORF Transcript_22465/g.30850 Transcript_22465/m.30850 type:complete len:208 (+) Transcript_22465:613-1236(+)
MSLEPSKRPTVEQVLSHPWMQGPMIDEASWCADFTRRKDVVDSEAKKDRDEKARQREATQNPEESVVHRGASPTGTQNDLRSSCQALAVMEYGPRFQLSNTQFFSTCQPLDYFCAFAQYLSAADMEYRVSGSKLKLKYLDDGVLAAGDVEIHVEALQVSVTKTCIKFNYLDPINKTDVCDMAIVRHFLSIRNCPELRNFCDATYDEV